MDVVRISVVITVPACLHPYLIGIQSDKIELIDSAVRPYIGRVAVRLLSNAIVDIYIENVPLLSVSRRSVSHISTRADLRRSVHDKRDSAEGCTVLCVHCNNLRVRPADPAAIRLQRLVAYLSRVVLVVHG